MKEGDNMWRKWWAFFAWPSVLWLTATVLAASDAARWGADYFPNVTLTTQDGRPVRFYDDLLKGKIVAIDLIYTTCQYACPLETARLAQVQQVLGDRVGRDVFFYSITIDPEHDTPAVLKAYAEKYHAGPGWLFLTGTATDIELISRKLGLYSEPNPSNKDGHTPSLLVGNEATGQWMRNSALDNPRFLARTIGDWMNSWRNARPASPPTSYANAGPLSLDPGQYAFTTHCAPCHTVGQGEYIGPDLAGVTRLRDRAWLARFIVAPQQMLAEGDPIANALLATYKGVLMPNLALTAADANAILAYLDDASTAARGRSVEPPTAAIAAGLDVPAMLVPYLAIQQALSTDTIEGVAKNAGIIALHAAKSGSDGRAVQAAARALQQASDLKGARAAFGRLGDAILIAAKASGASMGDELKVAYCPMARQYWVQRGERIQNPYFGEMMPECGHLAAEIPDLRETTSASAHKN
jgi:protein SCO1